MRKRSTARDEQDPPAAGAAPGGGLRWIGPELGAWLADIRRIRENPIVVYGCVAQNRRLKRVWGVEGNALSCLGYLVVGLLVLLVLNLLPLTPLLYLSPFGDDWYKEWRFLLLTIFPLIILPTMYQCTRNAMLLLTDAKRRIDAGSNVDESLAISNLSNREFVVGYTYSRLVPLWQWFGLFSFAICVGYFIESSDPLLNHVVELISLRQFPVLVDWLWAHGGLTTLLAIIATGIWAWVELVIASIIWFEYFACLGCGLKGAWAVDLAVFSMFTGQFILWLNSLHYYLSEIKLPNLREYGLIALCSAACVVLSLLSLIFARRYAFIRYITLYTFPIALGIVILLQQRLMSIWGLRDAALTPFVLAQYSFDYPYTVALFSVQFKIGTGRWLVPCCLLFLAQLVQLGIVLHFAAQAVHARRQRRA